ncbi:hypothetical protein NVIRENTERO_01502 [Sodalis praecaptivus]|nr:hypothetical protein NVIRENTERO_01502 [Sodalis praecaptivus]
MLIGYMRVSSNDERQSVALQRDALITAGVDPVICIRIMPLARAMIARDLGPALLRYAKETD